MAFPTSLWVKLRTVGQVSQRNRLLLEDNPSYAKHGGHTMYTERRPCKEAQMLSPRHLATIKQESVTLDLCLRQNNAAVLLKRANVDLVNNLMRSERWHFIYLSCSGLNSEIPHKSNREWSIVYGHRCVSIGSRKVSSLPSVALLAFNDPHPTLILPKSVAPTNWAVEKQAAHRHDLLRDTSGKHCSSSLASRAER